MSQFSKHKLATRERLEASRAVVVVMLALALEPRLGGSMEISSESILRLTRRRAFGIHRQAPGAADLKTAAAKFVAFGHRGSPVYQRLDITASDSAIRRVTSKDSSLNKRVRSQSNGEE